MDGVRLLGQRSEDFRGPADFGNIHKGRNLSIPKNYHCTEPYLCSCVINPLPTSVVKECLDELSPAISSSVNLSLEQGHFPDAWKGALVKSKLKKSNLELDEKKYRPVSNLQFLSKLVEKAVAQQAVSRVMACGLFPALQSAYRQHRDGVTSCSK